MSVPNAPLGLLQAAPIATVVEIAGQKVRVPWGGWFNMLRQWLFLNIPTIINSAGAYSSADAVANGAFGDGIHDDSAILQQTLNNTGGVLYLRPGLTYVCGTTLTVTSGGPVVIYGGGGLSITAASTGLSITANTNVFIRDITFTGNGSQTLLLINEASQFRQIENCFFSGTGGTGIAIQNNSNATEITNCYFASSLATGVALTSALNVNIVGCNFVTGITNTVTTSGTCTFNLRGCNTYDLFNPQVARALAYQTAVQSMTTGALVALTFDTNTFNFGSVHSTSSNPTRFTAPVAGLYQLWAQLQINSTTATFLLLTANKNGSALTNPSIQSVAVNNTTAQAVIQLTAQVQLAAGDFIEYVGQQATGGSVNTVSGLTAGALSLITRP